MRGKVVVWSMLSGLLVWFTTTLSWADNVNVCVEIVEHTEAEIQTKSKEKITITVASQAKAQTSEAVLVVKPNQSTITGEVSFQEGASASQEGAPALKEGAPIPENVEAKSKKQSGSLAESSAGQASESTTTLPTPPDKRLAAAQSSLKYMPELARQKRSDYVDNLPYGQTALVYLKRLIEHFVTHEPGYVSVDENCHQTITVELYPLERGWTAFARYSGTNREEKVDQLFASELSQFAERSVLALLQDTPISATINRENVLKSDSKKSYQRIKGSNHFILNVGTKLIGAKVNQVETSGDDAGNVSSQFHLFHPMKFGLGYRGRFESWGLEVTAHLGIGMGKTDASSNPSGGHIDYGGDTGLGMHFLRFMDPRGLTSFYLGAGASFEFAWFSVINDASASDQRSYLYGGGLTGDGVFGWEFMRAASVQFYLQGEINLPAYVMRSENSYGRINSWLPGISLKLGVVF